MSVFDKKKGIEEIENAVDNKIGAVSKKAEEQKEVDAQEKVLEEKTKELKDKKGQFMVAKPGKRKLKFHIKRRKVDKGTITEEEGFLPPNVVELERKIDWSRVSMWLSVFGIVAIVMIAQSTYMNNIGVMIILLFFGMGCFLPLGLVIGWLFLNIDMRCKIKRMMLHKNYGIVHFVLKGGRHLTTRIMNLDGDVIIAEMRMWIIDKKGVHYIDRDGKKQFWSEITSDNIKTLPANIPCLYLDYETMIPLKFYKEQSESNPQQVGATHLGYIANQIAKMLFFKKTMTFFYILIVVLTALTLVIAMQEAMWLNDMKDVVPKLNNKIDMLIQQINTLIGNDTGIPNIESVIPHPEE